MNKPTIFIIDLSLDLILNLDRCKLKALFYFVARKTVACMYVC